MKDDCDCGCNEPIATTPQEMLEFLAHRFEYAVVITEHCLEEI